MYIFKLVRIGASGHSWSDGCRIAAEISENVGSIGTNAALSWTIGHSRPTVYASCSIAILRQNYLFGYAVAAQAMQLAVPVVDAPTLVRRGK